MSAPPRQAIRAEQVTLVLAGVAQSLPVGFLLSSLLAAVVHIAIPDAAPGSVILPWLAAFLGGRIALVVFARRVLSVARPPERNRRIECVLMALKVYEGLCWGWLLVIGLPAANPALSILLMSLMGAVCGNAVSLLAPLRYLYLGLALPLLGMAVGTLWTMRDLSLLVLAACCILYVAGQYGQVSLANRRVREFIALRFQNVSLVERLQAETALAEAARADAERANANKSRVLAAAGHDLRQPVHALGLFLHSLGQTRLDPAQQRVVDSAKAASLASSDMLDALLDFSRIEAGVIHPRPVAFALQPLLDRLEHALAPAADAKGLIYRSPGTDAVVRSDPALVELILRNLILNAIRYTARGGVLIGCRSRAGALSIDVYDTGIGIPDDQQAEIFREFHQLGNPERDRQKGLGLGLAIVRGLATSLGHPLTLSSRPGRGSVFRLALPLARSAKVAPASQQQPSPGAVQGAAVLVIDDDPIVLEAMAQLLGQWGCMVRTAGSLAEARRSLDLTAPPAIIICDYRLPGYETGSAAIAALRALIGREVPALLVTGDTAAERLQEVASTGLRLMHKPVAPADLYRLIVELIEVDGSGR